MSARCQKRTFGPKISNSQTLELRVGCIQSTIDDIDLRLTGTDGSALENKGSA